MKKFISLQSFFLLFLLLFYAAPGQTARIKDIASIHGVRTNQLIGYGLVTGLNGTGDNLNNTIFTRQAIYNMMVRSGIAINPNDLDDVKIDNIAAVMVTATLPPFANPGMLIDVQVSSMGDADSLAGGTLLMTPLKGADGEVYAVAQGALAIGAFSFGGKAAKAQKKPSDRWQNPQWRYR
jgi:flagellar P-ring protein precursor FlgI